MTSVTTPRETSLAASESAVSSIIVAMSVVVWAGLVGAGILWAELPLLVLSAIFAAWPLALAERALAVRSKRSVVDGMQHLTRESDAARGWRFMAYSGLLAGLLAMVLTATWAGVLSTVALQSLFHNQSGWLSSAMLVPAVTTFIVFLGLLRYAGRANPTHWLLPMLLLAGVSGYSLSHEQILPMDSSLALPGGAGWSAALLIGGLLGGAGLMIRWPWQQQSTAQPLLQGASVVFAVAMLMALLVPGLASVLLAAVACLLMLLALAQPWLAVLAARGLAMWPALFIVLVVVTGLAELLWYSAGVIRLQQLSLVLLLWMTVNAFVLAIYAGWVMKMSHARKALNLPSEAAYNIWRIAIRWVAPLTLLAGVAALVGLI
ncbi:MAG: hypothetical protein ABIR53_07930 [Paraperlucidibaca sp.]